MATFDIEELDFGRIDCTWSRSQGNSQMKLLKDNFLKYSASVFGENKSKIRGNDSSLQCQ